MNFWNTFVNLCNEINKSPNAVAEEIGISSGSITAWKKDPFRKPQDRILQKISKYFNVSIEYLLGKENKKTSQGGEDHRGRPHRGLHPGPLRQLQDRYRREDRRGRDDPGRARCLRGRDGRAGAAGQRPPGVPGERRQQRAVRRLNRKSFGKSSIFCI